MAFVQAASSEGSPGFVPPAERVAVFDNDGTLWSEKPIPIQLDFTLFRLATRDPSLQDRQPYKAAVERDYTAAAEDALDRARTHGWTIVSVKDDWKTVFADL